MPQSIFTVPFIFLNLFLPCLLALLNVHQRSSAFRRHYALHLCSSQKTSPLHTRFIQYLLETSQSESATPISSTVKQPIPNQRTHPTSLSGFSMCQVQRVTNTCGHRNDHVLMSCRTAKSFLESSPECPNYSHRRSLLAVPIKRRLLDAANAGSITIHGGFHACTEPYCRMAIVRELRSAEGFVCMVPGCGRVG